MTTMNSDEREQAAPERLWIELQTRHTFTVKPDPYIETVEYLRSDFFNSNYEDLVRAALLREQNAATRMRKACVEKVRTMRDTWRRYVQNDPDEQSRFREHVRACDEIITALESITLDGSGDENEQLSRRTRIAD